MRATHFLLPVFLVAIAGCATSTGSMENETPPRVVHRVAPDYPESFRQARIQGTVHMTGVVPAEGGAIRDLRVLRSDDSRLEPYALAAVSQWRFEPATKDGVPVEAEFTTHIAFTLR